ncbi:MAG: beta-CASP ribonuclease aCPSF1 [Candidatus Thermoplasmatota archaeon]|nr:beta-CASP ribonuclease aCPSF1 [Candidatus Thermoplasmatota archaeon]
MAVEDLLQEVKKEIKAILLASIRVTDIDFEGAQLVIYTKDPDKFADNSEMVRELAKKLQKRIVVRPDPSVLEDIDIAEERIRQLLPEEANITNTYFEPDIGEVTIEAEKPGVAIGKYGSILNDIKKEIGWAPKVIRAPPVPSKTVQEIRGYIRSTAEDRKDFLRRLGRRLHRGVSDGEKWVRMTSLGGYREVGRSCTLLSTQDSKVLIDCGVDVSSSGNGSPYIHLPEVLPLESIDGVVVTHAHLDHSGLVPLLYKYGYDGPVYCTYPTRDVMVLMQMDYLKVSAENARKPPYLSEHIREEIKHSIPLNYGDTTDIAPDIRLTMHHAGHILGSSICHFHVGDGLYNIAFTGDIKYEQTLLFSPAATHFPRLEALVIESTYGGSKDVQPNRKKAIEEIGDIVQATLERGGKVLIPVFAIGRSQEVMIVLEQLMREREIPQVPVYLDGMIWEATAIHTVYPEYLNNKLRKMIFQDGKNPLMAEMFERVDSFEKREEILDSSEPAVVLATSGMMNGGPVIEYLKRWGDDEVSSLVFVGYQAEGTLGNKIQRGWKEINLPNKTIDLRMNVETCEGFSGHSDRMQLMNYVKNINPKPRRIIVNHGEESKCLDFASSIYKKYKIKTLALKNLETIRFR